MCNLFTFVCRKTKSVMKQPVGSPISTKHHICYFLDLIYSALSSFSFFTVLLPSCFTFTCKFNGVVNSFLNIADSCHCNPQRLTLTVVVTFVINRTNRCVKVGKFHHLFRPSLSTNEGLHLERPPRQPAVKCMRHLHRHRHISK